MKRRTGPRSRAGRYWSSPERIAWRTLVLESARASRRAAAISLRVRGTFALALFAASASRREGVGRPFFRAAGEASSAARSAEVWGSDLGRRNNALLPGS